MHPEVTKVALTCMHDKTAMIARAAVRALSLSTVLALALSACEGAKNPEFTVFDPKDQRIRDRYGTVTGQDGFTLFSTQSPNRRQAAATEGGGAGIGVNAYLWRGALETIDFMPLASADPFGGLIITDWYQPPSALDERLKLHVLILDRSLRADAVKVSVFKQVRSGSNWLDAPVDPTTALGIEDRILTKARQLRIASLDAG